MAPSSASREDTIAAAIGQLHQQQDQESDPQQLERGFKDTYGFDFANFSINPCAIPNLDPSVNELQNEPKVYAKFHNWLRLSPFGIWVTKIARAKPYAQCKYAHCQLQFKFDDHANTSNIIKHLKRRHKDDFELFSALLGRNSNTKSGSSERSTTSYPRKPFSARKELVPLLQNKLLPQRQLNFFIDTLLPLSVTSAFAQFLTACNYTHIEFLLSTEELVVKLDEYYHEFNTQLKQALRDTTAVNVLLETWYSPDGKLFLAVMASFCPNVALQDQPVLRKQMITVKNGPGIHVLDLINTHTTDRSITGLVIDVLEEYGITSKIGALTVNPNETALGKSKLEADLKSKGLVSHQGSLSDVRSLSHLIQDIISSLTLNFRTQFTTLLERVDRLTTKLTTNLHLRKSFPRLLNELDTAHIGPYLATYRQICALLKWDDELDRFFLENVQNNDQCSLSASDEIDFRYTAPELATLRLFANAASPLYGFLSSIQNKSGNVLSSALDYYLQLGHYFQACDRVLSGIFEEQDAATVGLTEQDLVAVSEGTKNIVFSILSQCGTSFNAQLEWAYAQPVYWAAHMLRPQCKTRILETFDEVFRAETLRSTTEFVNDFLQRNSAKGTLGIPLKDSQAKPKRVSKPVPPKKHTVLENAAETSIHDIAETELNYRSEWAVYLEEPTEDSNDYVRYWLRNQTRFPQLTKLALSLHASKISCVLAHELFHMSSSALNSTITQPGLNLKQATMLRNRLLSFETGHNLNYVRSVDADQWEADETRALSGADLQSGTDRDTPEEDNEVEPQLLDANGSHPSSQPGAVAPSA